MINLETKDVESVIRDVKSCKMIFSTSLHGIIVAHAYGIPAEWIHYRDLVGGTFKFYDYFSSVGIENYNPKSFKYYIEKGFVSCLRDDQLQVDSSKIREIQLSLLKSFPFKIRLNNYKAIIEKLKR